MRKRVEPTDVERRIEKPCLVRRGIQPAAPEELGAMRDVEGAELGRDAGDAEVEVADVG
jgi:hypothetical protein